MEAFILIGFKTIYKQNFTVMAKMLLISDEDLKSLIQEAVTNAVDGITKKIASRAARIYNNQIFRESRREDDHLSCGAGDSGGCRDPGLLHPRFRRSRVAAGHLAGSR